MQTDLEKLKPFFDGILESKDSFPVDFDKAWKWVGYSTKGNAKRIIESDFTVNIDYSLLLTNDKQKDRGGHGQVFITNDKQKSRGGYNKETIKLTVDCFKKFCMLARTDRGKEVREYFLECERKLKIAISALITRDPDLVEEARGVRNEFTTVVYAHGATEKHHFINITKGMKNEFGIKEIPKHRLGNKGLFAIMASEKRAVHLLNNSDAEGYSEVKPITDKSAKDVNEFFGIGDLSGEVMPFIPAEKPKIDRKDMKGLKRKSVP